MFMGYKIFFTIFLFSLTLLQSSLFGLSATPAQQSMSRASDSQKNPLTISEIWQGGKIIVLSDNSKWDVAPDQIDVSGGWLGPAEVEIVKVGSNKNYPYKMTNNWTGSSVMVKPHQQ